MSKMFSKLFTGVLICLLLTVSFLYYKNATALKSLKYSKEITHYEKKIVENQLMQSIAMDNHDIDMDESIFSSSDTIKLGDLIADKALIYKFSNRDCIACVQKQMTLLATFVNEHPKIPVFILYEFSHLLAFKNILQENKNQLPIWGIAKISISEHGYFILNKSGSIQSFYAPDIENDKLGANYLKIIKMKLK